MCAHTHNIQERQTLAEAIEYWVIVQFHFNRLNEQSIFKKNHNNLNNFLFLFEFLMRFLFACTKRSYIIHISFIQTKLVERKIGQKIKYAVDLFLKESAVDEMEWEKQMFQYGNKQID